jgi:hypothetical protein
VDVIGRHAGKARRRSGTIEEPVRLVIRRPRHGWIVGLLSAGVKAAAVLTVTVVALAVLAAVTAVLWRAGQARAPVLVLVYGSLAVAGCGFALGWSGRRLGWRRLPAGPDQLSWQLGIGRVQSGLVWEQNDPAITSPDEPPGEEGTSDAL